MKKFAYIVHLPHSYRKGFAAMHPAFGFLPEVVLKTYMSTRPISPFLWSEVTVSPHADATEGYIIMVPYTASHLVSHQWEAGGQIEKAVRLATSLGAELVGLGPTFSSITMAGRRLQNNQLVPISNGCTYTAVTVFQKIQRLLALHAGPRARITILGAAGFTGSLVSQLLATQEDGAFIFIDKEVDKIDKLARTLRFLNPNGRFFVSADLHDAYGADILVSLTNSCTAILHPHLLKPNAILLDAGHCTSIRATVATRRPDIRVIDGGMVAAPHIQFKRRHLQLPSKLAYASLAEIVLLAQQGLDTDYSVGTPSLAHAHHLMQLARQYAILGFGHAPDHAFGAPVNTSGLHEAPHAAYVNKHLTPAGI